MRKAIGWPLVIVGGLSVVAVAVAAVGAALYFEYRGIKHIIDGQVGAGLGMMFVTSMVAPMLISLLAIPGSGLLHLGERLLEKAEPAADEDFLAY